MLHQPNEVIAERYQILTTLGESSMGRTYSAFDLTNSQPVALKAISLRQASEWKILELFEREAKVLSSIDHPAIPDYIDYFELDTDDDRYFYLIQELVVGKSLAKLIGEGWHPHETEVKEIAMQLLNILTYLHSRSPAVIHRDIKPRNIIRCQDGKVYLVDFGAVQDVFSHYFDPNYRTSNTVIGTTDYISPEQIRGKVIPASDLYSLGCCLLFLMTRKSLSELPQTEMRLDLSSQVNISPDFRSWLAKMVEPAVEDRFDSAVVAMQAMQSKSTVSDLKPVLSKAENTNILVNQKPDYLRVAIPLGHYHLSFNKKPISGMGKFALAIAGLFVVPEITIVGICVWLFYLGSFPKQSKPNNSAQLSSGIAQKYIALEINPQTFCLERTTGVDSSGIVTVDKQEGKTSDIHWINNLGGKSDRVIIATRQDDRERHYVFGDEYLSHEDAKSLVYQVEEFIQEKSRSRVV